MPPTLFDDDVTTFWAHSDGNGVGQRIDALQHFRSRVGAKSELIRKSQIGIETYHAFQTENHSQYAYASSQLTPALTDFKRQTIRRIFLSQI